MTKRGSKQSTGRGGHRNTKRLVNRPSRKVCASTDETEPTVPKILEITPSMTCRDSILAAEMAADYCLILETFGLSLFIGEVMNLVEKKVDLSPAAKARILTALWANNCFNEFDKLVIDVSGFFGTSELFKLVPLMDKPRKLRQLQTRLNRIKEKAKPRTLKPLTREITELQKEPHSGNLTSSFSKRIAKWVSTISEDVLTFQAINFPPDNWKQVADLCHLKPVDFQVAWFLPLCFGAPAPEGTLVHVMTSVTTETLASTITSFPYLASCYSMIRQRVQEGALSLTPEAMACLAANAPVEDVIWFYEDIVQGCAAAEESLYARLRGGEFIASAKGRVNYPKLMERIMLLDDCESKCVRYLMDFASGMLQQITFPENNLRVAVFGDCSSSMSVAVNTASIMASIFTARLNAHLTFFHDDVVTPPLQPTTTTEVLQIAKVIKAERCTAPAACLWPYFAAKTPIDLFIIVTDEEENTSCHGYQFAPLFKEYLDTVNPHAKLFFVSFLSVRTEGQMVVELKKLGIHAKQFRFDASRPDLSKFDELLGLLTLQILDSTPKKVVSYAQVAATHAPSVVVPVVAPVTPAGSEASSLVALSAGFVELELDRQQDMDDEEWSDGGEWIETLSNLTLSNLTLSSFLILIP
ncbi:hypothetical protein HDU98_006172 [Podochytrium sp. JEL0797]|nr:hypothetical protein HDU98_006172 [Podochytrium sp. JEL0797]